MSKPVGNDQLGLAAQGQPRRIGVPQRVEYHSLACILDFDALHSPVGTPDSLARVVEAQGVNDTEKRLGWTFDRLPSPAEQQIVPLVSRPDGKRLCQLLRHDGMSRPSVFGLRNVDSHGIHIDVAPAQTRHLAKTHAAMQTDKRHEPGFGAAGVQSIQQPVRLVRRQKALPDIVERRQINGVKGQRTAIESPLDHPSYHTGQQRICVSDGCSGISLPPQGAQKLINTVCRDLREAKRPKWLEQAPYPRIIGVCTLALGYEPVLPVTLPCLRKGEFRAFFCRRRGLACHSANLGVVYGLGTHFRRQGRAESLACPSDVLAHALARGVAVVYRVTNVRSSTPAPLCALTGLYARIARAFALAHIATSLRPIAPFCDPIETITRGIYILIGILFVNYYNLVYNLISNCAIYAVCHRGVSIHASAREATQADAPYLVL